MTSQTFAIYTNKGSGIIFSDLKTFLFVINALDKIKGKYDIKITPITLLPD